MALSEAVEFDPSDREFLADPYPVLNRLREQVPLFYDAARERWFVTRHEDVRSCLRDKRLGRNFRHVLVPEEIGGPFVETTAAEEFAHDTDEANPEDASREPLPRPVAGLVMSATEDEEID